MLFTKECDYAIRILRALSEGSRKNVPAIAEEECITVPITYKVSRKLEQAGYIRSFRGTRGGYELSVDLSVITIYDVFRQVDREFLVSECMMENFQCPRNSGDYLCRVHQEMSRMQEMLIRESKTCSIRQAIFGTDSRSTDDITKQIRADENQ